MLKTGSVTKTVSGEARTDADWLVPSAALTAALGLFVGLFLPPGFALFAIAGILPLWLAAVVGAGGIWAFVEILRMMRSGADRPSRRIIQAIQANRGRVAVAAAGTLLAGLNMASFMLAKPLLNNLVPFWADPLLAAADRHIFFTDPWKLLAWLNSYPMALFYHRAWFALMLLGVLLVLSRAPSPAKSAMMLTYFLLWTFFGPLIHTALPAAGPVFYERMGYGSDFASIPLPYEMVRMSDYLWDAYTRGAFVPGGGISAMPSLHIATIVWVVLAVGIFARRWVVPVAAIAFLIFLLSISLGWHYAVDGLAGAAGTLLIWGACVWIYRHASRAVPRALTFSDTPF